MSSFPLPRLPSLASHTFCFAPVDMSAMLRPGSAGGNLGDMNETWPDTTLHLDPAAPAHTGQIRQLVKKATNGQPLLGALALSLAALLTACLNTPAQTAAEPSTPTPIAAELKLLQGYWEGEGAGGKCSITITGNSLHYRAGTNWWKTIFTLPAGTDPQQLHATIKDSSPPTNGIGQVVFAIFKIEDGTLTLAEVDMSGEPPKTFSSVSSRYVLKQVQPQKKNTEPPKTK
jgi:hypothetical protein